MVSDILNKPQQQLFAFPPLHPDHINDVQRIKSENNNNAAFPINSKLNEFFSSDFYLQNIHDSNYGEETTDSIPLLGAANPLSKEAEWYKDFVNNNNNNNDLFETQITLDDY